jgi:hypothetical protein
MIAQLLEGYAELRSQGELPELEPRSVLVEREPLTEADIAAVVVSLEASEGWLRRQSAVYRTSPGRKGQPLAVGLPLAGEWKLSATESKHLRPNGRGGWVIYHYREFMTLHEAENARKAGDMGQVHACLRERTSLLAEDGGKLAYYVYWGGDGAKIRRLFACFAGFEIAAGENGGQC